MAEEAIEILENRAWWDMVSMPQVQRCTARLIWESPPLWGECEMCGDGEVNASPGAHDFVIADDCLFYNDSSYGLEGIRIKYCPACGRPLTEEAWAELERRISGGTTDKAN